jgi:hypothetical protein
LVGGRVLEGANVGFAVGAAVGTSDGITVGPRDGDLDGCVLGTTQALNEMSSNPKSFPVQTIF